MAEEEIGMRFRLAQDHRWFETKRLQLVPFALNLVKATLSGPDRLGELLGVTVPETWPGEDFAEVLSELAAQMEETGLDFTWNWLIVHRQDRVVIGDAGFMDGPKDDKVEIGYSIVPTYRNQGYATEVALYLIHWALQQSGIRQVTAQCLDDNVGSIKVLEKIGMHQLAPDGRLLQWETS